MLSTKQQEYLRSCNHRWNIKIGATGSGKSWIDYAYVIPKRLMRMRGEGAAVILGNTQGTADRNILEPMRAIYGEKLVGTIGKQNAAQIFGQKVYVLGADNKKHVARIQGMTIEYAYGDEMTTWAEPVFQMLKSRLRCNHSRFDGTANPDSPQHYLKKFLDSNTDIYCQKSTIFDNPFLPQEFVENLCKEYAGTVYYRRYIEGEWALAEGLIYPMYASALCAPPHGEPQQIALAIDYGTLNAFAALLWMLYDGVWYLADCYYYSGRETGATKTDEEYGADLDAFISPYWHAGDDKIPTIIDPSAASMITLLKRRKWCRVRNADNDVKNGIRETGSALQLGRIKVNPSLKAVIHEFESYVWDDKATEDTPLKQNDHAMDAMRYFVKTMRISQPKREYKPIYMR